MLKKNIPQSNRESERLAFFDSASLILEDGREIQATAKDMGHGGAFVELIEEVEEVEHIQIGDDVILKITLFGRPSRFTASVAHMRNGGIGLRLNRE